MMLPSVPTYATIQNEPIRAPIGACVHAAAVGSASLVGEFIRFQPCNGACKNDVVLILLLLMRDNENTNDGNYWR